MAGGRFRPCCGRNPVVAPATARAPDRLIPRVALRSGVGRMRPFAVTLLACCLGAGALLAGCAKPMPPNRPPDLTGTVIGRTPRLPQRDGAAHLVIADPPVRVDVALGPDVRVLEALAGGSYRSAESDESWVGRVVQVWYAEEAAQTSGAPPPAGVISRRASYVVVTPRW